MADRFRHKIANPLFKFCNFTVQCLLSSGVGVKHELIYSFAENYIIEKNGYMYYVN